MICNQERINGINNDNLAEHHYSHMADSKSVLEEIANNDILKSSLIQCIRKTCKIAIKDTQNIILQLIPSHKSLEGNEEPK